MEAATLGVDSPLSSRRCREMLRSDDHLLRNMWAVEAWLSTPNRTDRCWNVQRDDWQQRRPLSVYFDDTLAGRHCTSNWYRGNAGVLGRKSPPNFTASAAPALLGFDPAVDWHCTARLGPEAQLPPSKMGLCYGGKHAQRCVDANFNILSLMGKAVSYNTCRNFEWQVCAAKGLLPGQGGRSLRFATSPNLQDGPIDALRNRSHLGRCRDKPMAKGHAPDAPANAVTRYSSSAVYPLEVCVFNELCHNGAQLFALEAGAEFLCDFSESGYRELQRLLTGDG